MEKSDFVKKLKLSLAMKRDFFIDLVSKCLSFSRYELDHYHI